MKGDISNALGMVVTELTEAMKEEKGLTVPAGVLVTRITDQEGAAATAGIMPGDVIVEVNRKPIRNISDFGAVIQGSKKGAKLLVRIVRNDSKDLLVLRIPD